MQLIKKIRRKTVYHKGCGLSLHMMYIVSERWNREMVGERL